MTEVELKALDKRISDAERELDKMLTTLDKRITKIETELGELKKEISKAASAEVLKKIEQDMKTASKQIQDLRKVAWPK